MDKPKNSVDAGVGHKEPAVAGDGQKKSIWKTLGLVVGFVASVLTIVLAIALPSTFWFGLAAIGAIVVIYSLILAGKPIAAAVEAVQKYPTTKKRLAEALAAKSELEKKIDKTPADISQARQLGEASVLARLRGDLSGADLELEAISATDDGVELFASRSGGVDPELGAWFAVKTRKLEKLLGYVVVVDATTNAHIRLKLAEPTEEKYWANISDIARTTETPPTDLKIVRDDIIATLQHQEIAQ
jgi:hypothetical protein